MTQVLTPAALQAHLLQYQKLSKKKIMDHFQADEKMLDYILEFWLMHGMIRIVNANCGPCQGCHSQEVFVESCFNEI